jgi:cell division septum initiation protein DivIVA
MTDQEKEIRARFENRLYNSEHYSEFMNHHEPDVEWLLDEVERLRKDNEELQKLVDKFSEANRRLRIAVANQK